jgi:uroporphyrinogen III methyltransferase/synthase
VDQAEVWRRALEAEGAVPLSYPTIEVGPPPDWGPLDAAFARLDSYSWLVFTSANAVRFAGRRWPTTVTPAALESPRIAAVGVETARALEALGFRVACLPELEDQDGLLIALGELPVGTRILFPQAIGGRDTLASVLRGRGCTVDVVPASQTVPRSDLPPPPPFDVAIFASPSALRAFVDRNGSGRLVARPVVVIGGTTAEAATVLGLAATTARAPRIDAVVEAIALVYAADQGDH